MKQARETALGALERNEAERRKASLSPAAGSEARTRIDDAVRKVWLAYRDASDVNSDMLTEQDMELWGLVTRHRAIQDRLDATLPNVQAQAQQK